MALTNRRAWIVHIVNASHLRIPNSQFPSSKLNDAMLTAVLAITEY